MSMMARVTAMEELLPVPVNVPVIAAAAMFLALR
jgi:hypothetical protein